MFTFSVTTVPLLVLQLLSLHLQTTTPTADVYALKWKDFNKVISVYLYVDV